MTMNQYVSNQKENTQLVTILGIFLFLLILLGFTNFCNNYEEELFTGILKYKVIFGVTYGLLIFIGLIFIGGIVVSFFDRPHFRFFATKLCSRHGRKFDSGRFIDDFSEKKSAWRGMSEEEFSKIILDNYTVKSKSPSHHSRQLA